MHAVGAGRQRDVEPIVDDDAASAAGGNGQNVCTQTPELAGFEIAFTNLQDIHAGFDRVARLRDQALSRTLPGHLSGESATVRDEMQDQRGASVVDATAEAGVGAVLQEDRRKLGSPCKQVHESDSAHSPAYEVVAQKHSKRGPGVSEIVLFPRG